MLVPIRFFAQKIASCVRSIDLKSFVLGDQLARWIPADVVHQGPNRMDFQVAIRKIRNLRRHDEAEEHGALHMVEGEVGRVRTSVLESFGDERGIGNCDSRKNTSRQRGHLEIRAGAVLLTLEGSVR